MPANVEIKARLEDFDAFHTLFKKVYTPKDGDLKTLEHCDTYFKCDNGRLKLREIKCGDDSTAELIFYDRNDSSGPKVSDYVKHDCSKGSKNLKESLLQAFGQRGEVKKTRLLYVVDQTRVHIDKVAGVGQFMELEVMLPDDQTAEEGRKIADEFMEKLNITSDMLIKGSYIDFINAGSVADAPAKKNGKGSERDATANEVAMEEAENVAAAKQVTKVDSIADNAESGTGDAKTES